MGQPVSLPLTVDAMSRGQIVRRGRLLDAVVQLVDEVGPENLQMRDVAERSGVALGTAYRYFSSKDHLLAAAMAEWHQRLTETVIAETRRPARPVPAENPMERVLRHVRRSLTGFQRQASFARLMVQIMVSTDPFASEAIEEMTKREGEVFGHLLAGVDPVTARAAQLAIEGVFMSELTCWVTGRATMADVYERVEAVIRLVLGGTE
jgi:TetR/AcrR family transcriptional regulator, cholesterol catabolism regulator